MKEVIRQIHPKVLKFFKAWALILFIFSPILITPIVVCGYAKIMTSGGIILYAAGATLVNFFIVIYTMDD